MSCGSFCGNCEDTTNTCNSPCGVTETNTAACESLPSQIENFTKQFFGEVVKTEVEGRVVWSLPCDLETGLENNSRAEDEGLACYFLRLFRDGIIGLTGPQGETGAAGTNGHNAYTVTLASFTQPTLGAPNVSVSTLYNPAILEGTYIFIGSSGWYLVNSADISGTLVLTLVKSLSGAAGTITAGKLVIESGFPGASVTGPTGPQGPAGPQGTPGESLTETNAFYFASIGTNFNLPIVQTAVTFVNSSPALVLTDAGKYKITAAVGLVGLAGVVTSDIVTLKLRNTSNSSDLDGSFAEINFLADTQKEQLVIDVIATTDGPNQTVALFGQCSTVDKVAVVALRTTITAVRVE